MSENEGQINQNRETYNQQLSKIEAYYIEKGGVGSTDFIAFGDALRRIVNRANAYYSYKEIEQGRGGSVMQKGLNEENAEIATIDIIRSSHEEMYPGFHQLYEAAFQQIADVVRNSPHKNTYPPHPPNAYHDLGNVRKSIIAKSTSAFSKAR